MNEQAQDEQSPQLSAQRDVAASHSLATTTLIEQCLKGALNQRPRKGQGRREARHGRRKRP